MSHVSAFKFPLVSKRLPPYVIENVVDLWCVRQGAIRYVSSNGRMWHVYVDVKEWLPGGFEMRDKLSALKAMGKYEKKDIPVHPLKFGRYLLVCPSFTLAEHDAYIAAQEPQVQEPQEQEPQEQEQQQVVNNWQDPHPIPPGWDDIPQAPPASGWDVELLD